MFRFEITEIMQKNESGICSRGHPEAVFTKSRIQLSQLLNHEFVKLIFNSCTQAMALSVPAGPLMTLLDTVC